MMKKVTLYIVSLFLAVVGIVGCSDSDDSYGFTGIGTVELNDTVFSIHYYGSTLKIDRAYIGEMANGARAYFSGTGNEAYSDSNGMVYEFNAKTLIGDITQEISYADTAEVGTDTLTNYLDSGEGFYGQDIHITRDWKRNDFLDATAVYPGVGDGSDDYFGLVADTEATSDSLLCFWLRLKRAETDTVVMITRRISVPVNCLRDSTKERVNIQIRRIDAYGDTVTKQYVYSYINWLE